MDELTIGELFYCLIQDIEDQYTMHGPHELDEVVECLDKIKEAYDKDSLTKDDIAKLNLMESAFILKGYEQFAEDLNVIIERIENEL